MAVKNAGGGSSTRLRNKNMAMASRMKREGIVRTVARCPVCNGMVGINRLYTHIVTCR